MFQKNIPKWKKKTKILRYNCPSDLARVACVAKVSDHKVFDSMQRFIEIFSLFIKQCYRDTVLSAEKI